MQFSLTAKKFYNHQLYPRHARCDRSGLWARLPADAAWRACARCSRVTGRAACPGCK